jgi:HTH-type transcriptional regulator/antitoxin HigA
MSVKRLPAEVFHPSEYIRDEMEARLWTNKQLAIMCGLSQRETDELIAGEVPVTPRRALALAKAFGSAATTWYRMQRTYDAGPAASKGDMP